MKTLDGVTRGSYSYIDSNAQLQTVNYVADALGFRVAATNLPKAPVDTNVAPVDNAEAPRQVEDTAEVKQARAEHLAAVSKARSEASDDEGTEGAPEPVEDTPEVKQAREEHLQAVEDAKNRSPVVAEQPQLIQSPLVQPAAIHLAASPVAVWRTAPASAFAYSVYAPGHPQLIVA